MSVVKHFRNYASAGLIGSLLGLVTFPLLTRSLSVADYGLLGLVMSTVTVFVAVGKLGLQHSLVRFFAAEQEKGGSHLRAMLATISASLLLMSAICVVIWLLYSLYVVPSISDSAGATAIFLAGTLLVPIKMLSSGAQNLLRANENSGINAVASVVEKLLRLALIVVCLFTLGLDASRVVTISMLSELVLFGILLHSAWPFLKGIKPSLQIASLTPLIAFGLPSMAGEIAGLLLEIGDRYVIEAYLGAEPLGLYAAAYNMSMYLEWVLIVALQAAMIPHYVRLYERHGEAETAAFVEGALRHYILAGVGIAAAFIAVAPELLTILAGDRYAEGYSIVPWVVAALLVGGGTHLFAAGCYIYKKPIMLVKWTLVAFVLNIVLNILTVPTYGLVAAAVATFACYLIRAVGLYRDASTLLKISLDGAAAVKALISGVVAWFAAAQIAVEPAFLGLVLKGSVSCFVYISGLSALSPDFRQLLAQVVSVVQQKLRGSAP